MIARFAVLALFASTLAAQMHVTVSPASGPAGGGTAVTITGSFPKPPYHVTFGSRGAETEHVNAQTLIAHTPVHLPGRSQIRIYEGDVLQPTDAYFTFEGAVPDFFERLLIPILLPRVHGAYGSEFETQLWIARKNTAFIQIWGLRPFCPIETCVWNYADDALEPGFSPGELVPSDFTYDGSPGRFIYTRPGNAADVAISLRALDVTRTALNLGTEIPIVRDRDFVPTHDQIVFTGVPANPLYRNTLRIYAAKPGQAWVNIGRGDGGGTVALTNDGDALFSPAYGVFTDFPAGEESLRVSVGADQPIWAFISVTNNETQMITTITPQP